jgi:hypothetical protein
MFTSKRHGYTGSAADKGSSPPALSCQEVKALPERTRLVITWEGGNGPHLYEMVDLLTDREWNRDHPQVTRTQVLREAGYVSLPADRAEAGR